MINFLACPARRLAGSGRTSVLESLLQQPSHDEGESHVFNLELKRRLFEWAANRVKERVEPTTWQAFWQTAVEDKPVPLVARELNLTTGAVYVARSRVMRQMRLAVERQSQLNGWEGGRDG
jgi:RNA polymerase sigma-70 factor (ECF subfamily)